MLPIEGHLYVLKHFTCTQKVGETSQNYVGKTHYFGIPTRLVLVGGSFSIVPLLLGALLELYW